MPKPGGRLRPKIPPPGQVCEQPCGYGRPDCRFVPATASVMLRGLFLQERLMRVLAACLLLPLLLGSVVAAPVMKSERIQQRRIGIGIFQIAG